MHGAANFERTVQRVAGRDAHRGVPMLFHGLAQSTRTLDGQSGVHEGRFAIRVIDEELLAGAVQFGVPRRGECERGVGKAVDERHEVLVVLVAVEAERVAADAKDHVLEGCVAIVDGQRFGVGV